MRAPLRPIALSLLALAPLCACSATRASQKPGPDTWLKASPSLQQEIDRRALSVPYTHRLEDRVELIRWFAGVGEPAYPTLLELADDERPHVAGTALAALGSTGDPTLIEPLRRIRWRNDDRSVRLERARALAQLGDWSETNLLIDALRDDDAYVRAVAARTLEGLTGESFGYDPRAEASAREAGVARWERWWERAQGEVDAAPAD